jgi:hypothetical protein
VSPLRGLVPFQAPAVSEAESGLAELHHAYDAAVRLWAEVAPAEVRGWLSPSMAGRLPAVFERRQARLVVPVVEADLILEVGPQRLMQVEFETSPGSDLVQRMLDYRSRIMYRHPGYHLTQYIVVLGSGLVTGFDDLERLGFALQVKVVYLRDCDPQEFLRNPAMAPFAVLARGSRAERERSLGAALRLIRDSGHPQKRVLLQVLDGLAGIRLDRATVERTEKENGMSIEPLVEFYLDTELGQRMVDIGRQQGLGQGLEQGREQGLEQGRERLLLALMRVRFGDDPELPTVARRLAAWPEEAAITAITAATTPLVLLNAQSPSGT